MDAVLPIFFLAGGEIFLALIAARVALWVLRGWRDYRRSAKAPPHPRGPGGGLRAVGGGATGRGGTGAGAFAGALLRKAA